MQVRPDQLQRSIDSGIKPAYLVSGDEPLQVMESLDAIRLACRQQGFEEREVFDIDKDFDWQRLVDEAATMSLFSSRRIIECRMPTGKPGREGSAVLKEYLARPPEDNVLIICTGKLDKGSKNTAWYKALDSAGIVVACWPIQGADLDAWIRARFAALGMEADSEVIRFVNEHVEGNLLAADQEITKFQLLLGPGRVDLESLQRMMSDNSRYSIFELTDAALLGDRDRVHKIVDNLCAEGVEPVVVNWALAKEVRLLALVSGQTGSPDTSLTRAGVWRNRLNLFRNALTRHAPASFRKLLVRCSRIDRISKGVEAGNCWDEIRSVSLRLAARSRR